MTNPLSPYGEFATAIEGAQRVKSAFDLYGNNDPNTISKAYQVANKYNTTVDVVLAKKDDFFNQYDFETEILPTITQKALKQPVLDLIGDPNALPVVKNNIQDLSNLTDSLDPLIKDRVVLNSVEKVFSNQLLNQQQNDFSFSKMELNKETIMNMPVSYPIVTGDKATDKALAQKQLGITRNEANVGSVLSGVQATLRKAVEIPTTALQDIFTLRGQVLTPEQEQAFNEQYAQGIALQANPLFAEQPSIPSVNLPVSVLSNEQKKRIKISEVQAYLAQPQFEGNLNILGFEIPKQDIWDYGVTNLVQSSPALLAGVITRSANVAVSIGSLQSGLDQYLTVRQRNGGKSDAFTAGALNAGIEFATETAPMGALFDLFSGTFGKELGKKEFAKFLGKYVFKDLAGEQVASFAQDAVDTAIANPNKTWGQYFGEGGDRAYQTAVGSLFSSAVFGGTALGVRAGMETKDLVSRAYDRAQSMRSTENQVSAKIAQSEIDKTEALQSANGLYQTLNQAEIVKQTNPIILNKLVENITQESGVTDIYLDAQSLRQDISKGKISLDEIAQASPFLNASIQESFVSGTDITIPLVDFIQSFSGTPLAQNIVKYTKFNPDASSLSEVENFNEDDLRKDIEKIITGATVEREFNDSTKRVQKTIQTQIENTNRVPKTISSDASKLFATTFESIAMDEGITPEQAFERYGFDIVDSVIDNGKIVKSKTVEGNIISGEYIPSTARPQIALYSSPNMTTILHEFGHAYLDILFKRAGSQSANEKVLDDTKTVLDFFGIENLQTWNALSFEEQSPYHEKFAETYESYLIEGKAVKPKLEKILLKFSAWLQNFYSNFVSPATKYLITPEIRRVFDNMVLSQAEVKQASETLNLTPIPLEDFTKAGLSEQDYESYLVEYQASDAEAVNALQQKQLRVFELFSKKKDAIVKGLKNRFEGQRRILKTFVIADMIKTDKDYRLFSFLKTKKINQDEIDLPNKINEASLKNLLNLFFGIDEIPENIEKYVLKTKNFVLSPYFYNLFEKIGLNKKQLNEYKNIQNSMNYEKVIEFEKNIINRKNYFNRKIKKIEEQLKQKYSNEEVVLYEQIEKNARLKNKSYRAIRFFTENELEGEIIDFSNRINKDSLKRVSENMYGINKDAPWGKINLRYGRKKIYTESGGVDIAEFADLFGYKSPEDLLNVLLNPPNFEDLFFKQAKKEMVKKYGTYNSTINLRLEAVDILHSQIEDIESGKQFNINLKIQKINKRINEISISVEDLSDFFQYDSPESLLAVLLENPNFDTIIDQKVDEAMVQNFGDAFSPQNMAQKAIDVLHKDSTQKIIQKELEVIELQAGKNKTNINFMKQLVGDYIDKLKISLFKPKTFQIAEQKAARLFSKSKNTEERISYKRQQLFNFLMYQKSLELKDKYYEVSNKIKSIQKAIKDKKIIGENAEAINLLLEQYDFRKTTKTQFSETLEAYIDRQIEKSLLPENFKETIPEDVLNQTTKKPYKDLTVKEFNDFIQALEQLEFIGRIEKQQFDANKKYTFEQEKEALLNDLKQYNRKSFDEQGDPIQTENEGFFAKFASEAMSPEESLLAITDNKPLTPWESFFNRLSQATVVYDGLKESFASKINNAVNLYAGLNVKKSLALRKMKTEKKLIVFSDGSQQSFTKEEAILVTLFNGTQEGRERLQSLHGFDQGKIAKIIDTILDNNDIKLVKALWGATKPHFKLLQEINLKTTGQKIEQSIVSPFETSKFKFDGGYVPLVYQKDLANNIEQAGQDNYRPVATNRGSSKARLQSVSKDKKLDFSFGGILFKIDQTMRDIAYRQAVLSMNRLLKDKEVQPALTASFGEERFKILQNSIKEAVNPSQLPDTTAINFVKYAEKSAMIAFLSGTSTALLNTMNLIPLSKEVGILNVIKSSSKFLNPTNYYLKDGVLGHALLDQAVNESDFIAKEFDAMDTRNASAIENLGREADTDPTTLLQDYLPDFKRVAFFMMSNVTKLTGAIAYDSAKMAGKTKAESEILYRQNVGTSRQVDKVGSQQNMAKSLLRILMAYLSYMQKQFSVLSASFSVARKNKNKEAWLNFMQEYFFRFVVPSVLLTFIQGAGGDDNPEIQNYLASTIAYTVGGGGIYGLWLSGLAYWSLGSGNVYQQQTKFATPIASVLDGFKNTMKTISKAEDVEDWEWQDWKNLIRSGGVVLKAPSNLAISAGSFATRLNNYFDGTITFEELVFGENK